MNLNKLYLEKNACFIEGERIEPTGIMVHSTGANNKFIKRYVGPNDGKLGENVNGNHWNTFNPDGNEVCVHAFIGRLEDNSVATYQTLPWDYKGWHCGGLGNNSYIGFEICEDNLEDVDYFNKVYQEAIELCAYLINTFNIDPNNVIDHSEGYELGIASNHSDTSHWFKRFNKNMDDFREDLRMKIDSSKIVNTKIEKDENVIYRVQIGAFENKENAINLLTKAKSLGFNDAFIGVSKRHV